MEKLPSIGLRDFLKAVMFEHEKLSKFVFEKGDVFLVKGLPWQKSKIIVAANPVYIKHIFIDSPKKYTLGMRRLSNLVKSVFGEGLFTTEDYTVWKKDREILNKLFTKDKLIAYSNIMVTNIEQCFKHWEQCIDKHIPIYIDHEMTKITLGNLTNTMFAGTHVDIETVSMLSQKIMHFTQPNVAPFVKLFGIIPTPLYFQLIKLRKQLRKIEDKIIKESFENSSQDNLVTAMSKAYGFQNFDQLNNEMLEHLHDEMISFLISGHETTTALLVQTCILLSLYPMIADKIREEVTSVLGSRNPTYEDLEKLTYTRAVLQESLRLQPPSKAVTRLCVEDDTINNHQIKKDDVLFIPIFATLKLKRYWQNPEGFNPDRFLQTLTSDQRLVYIPFGIGDRTCIGSQFALTQSTLAIAMLSQRYKLELTQGSSMKRSPEIVNRPDRNTTMIIQKL